VLAAYQCKSKRNWNKKLTTVPEWAK